MLSVIRILGLSIFAVLLAGCASTTSKQADLKALYDRTAQYHKPDRNPVIVIPGILGSRLVDEDTGKVIWGAFRANYADPATADGARAVALPIDGDLHPLWDHVEPGGVLEDLELNLGIFPVSIQAYRGILTTLGAGGYRDQSLGLNTVDYGTDHFTCFQFDYDWRRDIAENAAELKRFMDERRVEIQANYEERYGIKNAPVKFDIVAHSMGGLLTRYFLRYGDTELPEDGPLPRITWAGTQDVERVILVAPPNAGSAEAFDQLIHGFNTGRPILPHYQAGLLGTFPSIYQLLPRARHSMIVWDEDKSRPVDNLFDPALWQKHEWGLAGKDEENREFLSWVLPDRSEGERYAQALKFQAMALKQAERFHAAIDRPANRPDGIDLFLVAGDSEKTPAYISVDSQTGEIDIIEDGIGDGTVLRSSALMDERVGGAWHPTLQTPIDWSSTMFLFSNHREITSEPVFEDNVLYWLLEDPRKGPQD